MPNKFNYHVEIQKMMFVAGAVGEPSVETTGIIEDIVRDQVIEMLQRCINLASRRGSRSISTTDIISLISHDKGMVFRLQTYLSWKDVRRTAKDNDLSSGASQPDPTDFLDDAEGEIASGAGPVYTKQKRVKIGLPWEVASFFSERVPERAEDEDEDEIEANAAALHRLRIADERTRDMASNEYVYWSECRQASFTYRKVKKFLEWAGFGTVIDAKPNDDIVDTLGFLTFEMVQTLTEEALKVKEFEDRILFQSREKSKKRKREESLFQAEEGRTPIEPRHVEEAFRRLKFRKPKSRAMRSFSGRVVKSELTLV